MRIEDKEKPAYLLGYAYAPMTQAWSDRAQSNPIGPIGSPILAMLPILVMTSWDLRIDIFQKKMLKMPDSDSLPSVPVLQKSAAKYSPGGNDIRPLG
jgi:hypothetical protein